MKNLFTILFTISYFLTYATDLYVFPGGTSPNYSSIHTAVNAAVDGDRVLVAPGTYIENITMPAVNITIVPLADGGNYTIAGNFDVTATYDGKKAIIVGAIIQGDFGESNNTSSCNGSGVNELNIINCEFYQDFYPNYCIITNIYYSTFHCNGNYMQGMYKEIIGNSFLNTNADERPFNCRVINSTWDAAANALYGDDKVLKVYGNHFINSKVSIRYEEVNCWIEDVHVANNFFEHSQTSPYYTGSMNYTLLDFPSSPGSTVSQVPDLLVENNTFRKADGGYSGWGIYQRARYSSNIIRNNVFYGNYWTANYPVFHFSLEQGIAVVTNNLFNNPAWPLTLTTSNLTNPSNMYFAGSLSGGSINSSDNFFNSSSVNSSEIANNSGIVTTSYAINNGLDIMECRDIDDTQNDLGTWGGPHSWDNYHSPSTGKGRIIDIQMPSTIYGLPGVTFEVKSKAIRTN